MCQPFPEILKYATATTICGLTCKVSYGISKFLQRPLDPLGRCLTCAVTNAINVETVAGYAAFFKVEPRTYLLSPKKYSGLQSAKTKQDYRASRPSLLTRTRTFSIMEGVTTSIRAPVPFRKLAIVRTTSPRISLRTLIWNSPQFIAKYKI